MEVSHDSQLSVGLDRQLLNVIGFTRSVRQIGVAVGGCEIPGIGDKGVKVRGGYVSVKAVMMRRKRSEGMMDGRKPGSGCWGKRDLWYLSYEGFSKINSGCRKISSITRNGFMQPSSMAASPPTRSRL